MKRITMMIGTVMCVWLLGLLLPANAQMTGQRPHEPRGMMPEGPYSMESMKDKLNLTDEQMNKLKALRSDYRKETIKKKALIQVAQMEFWEMLEQKDISFPALEKKTRELETLRADLMVFRIKGLQKAKEFLTAEQFEVFRSEGLKAIKHRAHPSMSPMMRSPMRQHPMMQQKGEYEEEMGDE